MEWFLQFFDHIAELPPDQQPIQCTCRAGELIFVPSGWWHAVINLEETVAVTQNFVSPRNLRKVLYFLREKKEQVSGVGGSRDSKATLYDRFHAALQARPHSSNRKMRLPGIVCGAPHTQIAN